MACRVVLMKARNSLVVRWAIYKTRNTGTGNGMRGMQGTRGMFTRIPGNLLEDSGECYYFNIPGNVPQDSGECSKRFRGMFEEIPGNIQENSGECSRRFWGMLKKIPCWQRFSKILKKIERFIMQLNENRIKGYILKYNQKSAQKVCQNIKCE